MLFKTVPLLGVAANLAAVWLLQPVMALGALALVLGTIYPTLALPFVFICQKLVALLLFTAEFFGSLPFITLHFVEYWQMAWIVGALILSVMIICRSRTSQIASIAAVGISAVYIIAAFVSFGIDLNRADIVTFEQSDCVAVVKGGHAVLLDSPGNKWQRFEITNALSTIGVEQLDAIIITDSKRATYDTAKLADDFNCHTLCAPNDRTAAVFCHSSYMELRSLPHNSTLFDRMMLDYDGESFEIVFKNGKLLKSSTNCDIIGRYSSPMPIDGIKRYRVTL